MTTMFKLKFATDNAAFEHYAATETTRILREIAQQIKNGDLDGTVRDINGNIIGTYELNGD